MITINSSVTIKDAVEISVSSSDYDGIIVVVDDQRSISGTITDGDFRRAFFNSVNLDETVEVIMNSNPIYFQNNASYDEILRKLPLELLKRNRKSNRFLGKIVVVDNLNRPVRTISYHELWEQRVATHRHLVILGLGYVGLTMALVLADAGFIVTGVEADDLKRETLKKGKSYIHEHGLEALLVKTLGKSFFISATPPKNGDVYIISVGTPVESTSTRNKRPNLAYLENASDTIGKILSPGNLVILRSTVPLGTTKDIVLPILEAESNLKGGRDFHLAFAPERTAEGNALKELRSLPQIIGGLTNESTEAAAAIFRDITRVIVRVNSLEEAEMAKLMNNSFRDYVFAFSNQVAKIASEFNVDIFNVINAANEGYVRDPIPLPSPGVGGPCLTKDPYIFAAVAEKVNEKGEFFKSSRGINESMHAHVTEQLCYALRECGKIVEDSHVLIMGMAFKGYPETGDIRNSSPLEIAELLRKNGVNVSIFDPVASKNEMKELGFNVVELPEGFMDQDAIVFLNNHKSFESLNLEQISSTMALKPILYDGWNQFNKKNWLDLTPSIYLNLSCISKSL